MVRHNNMIPNGHFHKKWQIRVKLWFDQAMKKIRRKRIRDNKLIRVAPKPIQLLRPVVHCPTVRYNLRMRPGRGFTLLELKQAGINKNLARTIGIAVDRRRRDKCVETVLRNVQRLKEYRSMMFIYPKSKKIVATDNGKNLNKLKTSQVKERARIPTEEEKKFGAYITLRRARCDEKYLGLRAKKKLSKNTLGDEIKGSC